MPKDVVMEWAAAFNRHDAAAMAALYHDDSMNVQLPRGEPVRRRRAMLDAFTAILRALPDTHSQIEHFFEDGEWVVIEWRFDGTMRGEFAGHAPTGRSFTLRESEFFHVTHGKIRLQRGYWDKATWFRQLALPID
jgi:steroid delta-isomerase-like uncharacterized protein